MAANLAPALLRSYEEENRLMLEQQLYDKYMAMGMGPQHIGNDEQEVCRPAWRFFCFVPVAVPAIVPAVLPVVLPMLFACCFAYAALCSAFCCALCSVFCFA